MNDDKDWPTPRNFAGFGYRDVTVKLGGFDTGEFRKSVVYGPGGTTALLATKGGNPQVTPLTKLKQLIPEIELNGPFTLTTMVQHSNIVGPVTYGRVVDGVHFIQSADRCIFLEVVQLKTAVFTNTLNQTATFNFAGNSTPAVAGEVGHQFTETGVREYGEAYACALGSMRASVAGTYGDHPDGWGHKTGVWAQVRPITTLPLALKPTRYDAIKTLRPDSNLSTKSTWNTTATAGTLLFSGPSSTHRIGNLPDDVTAYYSGAGFENSYLYHQHSGFGVRRDDKFVEFKTPVTKTGFLHAASDSYLGTFPLDQTALVPETYGETLFNLDKFSEYTGDVCQPFHGYLTGGDLYSDETKATKVSQVTTLYPTFFIAPEQYICRYFNFDGGPPTSAAFHVPFRIGGGTVQHVNGTTRSDAVFLGGVYGMSSRRGTEGLLTSEHGLYCDGNRVTWLIKALVSSHLEPGVQVVDVKMYVVGVFQAAIPKDSRFSCNALIGDAVMGTYINFGNGGGVDLTGLVSYMDSYEDGSRASTTAVFSTSTDTQFPNYAKLHGQYMAVGLVAEGTFSGNGRLASGHVGEGLSADIVPKFVQPNFSSIWLTRSTAVLLFARVPKVGELSNVYCRIRQVQTVNSTQTDAGGVKTETVTLHSEIAPVGVEAPTALFPPITLKSVLTYGDGTNVPIAAQLFKNDVLVYTSPNPSEIWLAFMYSTLVPVKAVNMHGYGAGCVDAVIVWNKWISTATEQFPNAGYFAESHSLSARMSFYGEITIGDPLERIINPRTNVIHTDTVPGAFV